LSNNHSVTAMAAKATDDARLMVQAADIHRSRCCGDRAAAMLRIKPQLIAPPANM